jgi:hypothetical protein
MTDDSEISRRYRSLPREEPPRHLDDAILAGARRAVASRGRWYFPVAAAAVLVLAVAVTVQVQKEEPGEELVVAQPAQAPVESRVPPTEERKAAEVDTSAKRESARGDVEARLDPQGARAKAAPVAPPPAASPAPLRREAASAALASSSFAHASPEQWLQGIADLRKQNRDDEADRQLAEFRRRYPGYKISKEMLEKLELPK